MSNINIKANDETLRSVRNMMQVTHNKEEFVLDFMLSFPPQGEFVSRSNRFSGSHEANIARVKRQRSKTRTAIRRNRRSKRTEVVELGYASRCYF